MSAAAETIASNLMTRVQTKVQELTKDIEIDASRIAQEVALLAERADVQEELVRIRSHVAAFREALGATEPIGKRLGFLVQELGREINTIGSKSQQLDITEIVIEAKSLLEQVREQIQNVE